MAATTRTPAQRTQDRAAIARLHAEGRTQREIAQELGITQQMASYYLGQLRRQWQRQLRDVDAARAQQLIQLTAIRQRAWSEWHRSKEDRTVDVDAMTSRRHGQQRRTSRRRETRLGDPRYLAVVLEALKREAALLGLEPQRPVAAVPAGSPAGRSPIDGDAPAAEFPHAALAAAWQELAGMTSAAPEATDDAAV